MKKIGVLGGTFDPIHLGHLRLAEEIGEELSLTKVYLIPSASPPHKAREPVTPFNHRLTMARLAINNAPMLEVLDLEGKRPGPSYSVETLGELCEMFIPGPEIFFIVGIEAFLEIKTWKDYRNLFNLANFLIILRAGYSEENLEPFLSTLDPDIKKNQQAGVFIMPSGKRLIVKAPTLMDISSTHIRQMVSQGRSIRFLVPGPVMDYIIRERLYAEHGKSPQGKIMS